MASISVLGTAIVNGTHWLYKLIKSIDFTIDNFVVFNNNGRGQITSDLDKIKDIQHPFIKKIHICHLPANLGCSTAWNLIIKSFITSSHWVITNHDISFTKGFLETLYNKSLDPEVGMIHGARGEFNIGTWDIFLIKDWVIKKYGLFDENFYPAYNEDWDYLLRFIHDPIKKDFVNLPYYHGDTLDYAKSGGQTYKLETDRTVKYKIDLARHLNETEYMDKKWGPTWALYKPYKFPKIDSNPGNFTYDLDFIRKKYLGF